MLLQMMMGYLKQEGLTIQRKRVRAALSSVDPAGAAERWGHSVSRRVYHVAMPNSLWHMDSHLKLIRYTFICIHTVYNDC